MAWKNKEKGRTYYKANKEKKNAQRRLRYQKNKEKIKMQVKTYSESPQGKARSKIYREAHREKQNAYNRAWYDVHKEEMKIRSRIYKETHRESHKARHRAYLLKRNYNMSQTEYDQLLEKQNKLCAICGKPETRKIHDNIVASLSVDHNHQTGEVRGLLCSKCNFVLSFIEEHIDIFENFINYLFKKY